MSGQLALPVSEEVLVPAAVWETLPPERQRERARSPIQRSICSRCTAPPTR